MLKRDNNHTTLAANPTNKAKLRLGEEIREIEDGLRQTNYGSHFSLKEKWAVRPRDVQDALRTGFSISP